MAVVEPMAFTTGALAKPRTLPSRATISGDPPPTTSPGHEGDWLPDVKVQIKELLLLDPGWDGSVAAPISGAAVEAAIRFLQTAVEFVEGVRRPYVSPTANGGVNVEWHGADAHFDVTVEGDAVWVYASGPDAEWEGPLPDITTEAVGVLTSCFTKR